MTKQRLNWPEIKQRYLMGEKPSVIAQDYGLTAKQVSDKAHLNGWVADKSEILEKAKENVISQLDSIHQTYGSLIEEFGKDLKEAKDAGLVGLTVQDGEGLPNKTAQEIIKAGLASYIEKQKHYYKIKQAEITGKQDINITGGLVNKVEVVFVKPD